MTIPKFIVMTLLLTVIMTIVKLFFINVLNIESFFVQCLFWLVIAALSIAVCRRFGVINYLEAVVIIVIWIVFMILTDELFLTPFTGFGIYHHLYLWISYPVMGAAVFIFHQKRHVEIRRTKQYK